MWADCRKSVLPPINIAEYNYMVRFEREKEINKHKHLNAVQTGKVIP